MKEKSGPRIDNDPDVIKIPKIKNTWKISTFILIIIIIVLLIMPSESNTPTKDISGQDAGQKLVNYLTSRTEGEMKYVSYKDLGNIYEITVNFQRSNIPIYITKDGNYFVQGAIPLAEIPSQPNNPTTGAAIQVSKDDDAILGDENAPVTIIEFSDFQCPFCARFHSQTLPLLKSQYIDTGKVKFIYRDFPLSSIHPDAQKAAEAAECAGEQNAYYKMHDKIFENQNSINTNSLKKYAEQLRLDLNKFNNCLDSGKMASEVQKDLDDGKSYGVTGTPAFFINGKFIEGAQPFETFKNLIEQELSN